MRPANIITAMADIMAGFAASGAIVSTGTSGWDTDIFTPAIFYSLPFLLISTIGLYGGGVVFNDIFDAKLDAIERPERPIPSGRATLQGAVMLGIGLLILGIAAAFIVSLTSGILAATIAMLALVYDKFGKHNSLLGPINMGVCRGGNLLLGLSAIPAAIGQLWFIAFIPIIYIAAITTISRGEVHGGNKNALYLAVFFYITVIFSIAGISLLHGWQNLRMLQVLPFLLLFSWLIFPPLLRALQNLKPQYIGKAVKAGILALIIMDAAIATGFVGWFYGLIVLLLFPLSRFIAKKFAVT
jgi:4-hydroxybenzoate polyprenyltransferase